MTVPRPLILCIKNKTNKPQSRCMGFLTLYGKVTNVSGSKALLRQILVIKQSHVLYREKIYHKRQGYGHFSVEHLCYRKH